MYTNTEANTGTASAGSREEPNAFAYQLAGTSFNLLAGSPFDFLANTDI